jgi:hypothetical protein
MEGLIKEYQLAQERVWKLRAELAKASDGFMYITSLRSYGSVRYEDHSNTFTVQEFCDEYNGDDGIVDVYTNNPDHGISTYGDVYVKTAEELDQMGKDNVSMSQAIANWMAR